MLQNRELRIALTEWPAAIQDAVEEQTALWRLGDERLEPLLHQAILNLAPAYQILTEYEQHRLIDEAHRRPSAGAPQSVYLEDVLKQ